MSRDRAVLICLAGAIAVCGIGALAANATPPGKNGKIAFSRYRFVDSPLRREIWVSNPDGTGLRRLSRAPANEVDSSPSWAPDGSRILFTRCPANEDGACGIWAVKADGSGQLELSEPCVNPTSKSCVSDDGAVYSPDGRSVVFNRGSETPFVSEIAIGDPDLQHVRAFPAPASTPDVGAFAWSPDGRRIAFEARNDTRSAVFVADADGGGRRRVTPWRLSAFNGDRIDWSPDGSRILFRSTTSEQTSAVPPDGDVYTIRPDVTGLRRLTHLPPGSGLELGSFSPDGKWIVFATTAGATPGGAPWPDVYVIRADGTGLRAITRTRNWEGSPDWGPG